MAVKKAVWIRMLIYVPLLGFFGYQALSRFKAGKEAEGQEQAAPDGDQPKTRTVTLPDGRTVEVYEVTPDQAEMMFGAAEGEVPDELPPVDKEAEPDDKAEPGDVPEPGDEAGVAEADPAAPTEPNPDDPEQPAEPEPPAKETP